MLESPSLKKQDDIRININYSSSVFADWVESGIAEVDAFLSALGFSNVQQVQGFCSSRNVLLDFSTEDFIRSFLRNDDKTEISRKALSLRGYKFLPVFFSSSSAQGILNETSRPVHSDFYQFLFSWVTQGHDPQKRQNYIDYCKQNGANSNVLPGLSKRDQYAPVLKSFKDNVDVYLTKIINLQNSIPSQIQQSVQKPVSEMTRQEKVAAAIWRALPLLPAEVAEELKALLDPVALAIIVVVLIVWAASHFFGVGEIADVIIIIVGIVSLGPIAWKAGEELIGFAMKSVYAKTEADLDQAAKHLAEAISLVGVQVVMALLLKKAPKVFKKNPEYPTLKAKDLPKTQRPAGEWFYKPKTQAVDNLGPGVLGNTSIYGDIQYLSRLTGKLKTETILHEKVHAFLTPKLYPLRNLRVRLNWNGYAKSYLLRYLEEAIAETVAQVGTHRFRNAVVGIKFPVKEGYVTLAEMGLEVKGILLGPVNSSGMIYRAYLTLGTD